MVFTAWPQLADTTIPPKFYNPCCFELKYHTRHTMWLWLLYGLRPVYGYKTKLNPPPVFAGDKKVTLNLNVDFCVANAHIVTGLPQKKGVNSHCCQMYTEIKYVKEVSCVGQLSSVNLVTIPHLLSWIYL